VYRSALDAANSHPPCVVDSHADVARSHAPHDSCDAPSWGALLHHYVHARYLVRFRAQKGEDSQRALRVMLRRLHRWFTQALWHQKPGGGEILRETDTWVFARGRVGRDKRLPPTLTVDRT